MSINVEMPAYYWVASRINRLNKYIKTIEEIAMWFENIPYWGTVVFRCENVSVELYMTVVVDIGVLSNYFCRAFEGFAGVVLKVGYWGMVLEEIVRREFTISVHGENQNIVDIGTDNAFVSIKVNSESETLDVTVSLPYYSVEYSTHFHEEFSKDVTIKEMVEVLGKRYREIVKQYAILLNPDEVIVGLLEVLDRTTEGLKEIEDSKDVIRSLLDLFP